MNRPFHDVPPIVQAAPPPAERRVALVIGNGRYVAERDVLANPPNDARALAEKLTAIGFFGVNPQGDDFGVDFDRPGVSPLLDLDLVNLGRAFRALEKASRGARQAVIYFAGHGIEVDGQNYLIPTTAKLSDIADVKYETHSLSRALESVQGATGLRLVILDACRNNPFQTRLFGTRGGEGGLAFVDPGSTLVFYASKHGKPALDGIGQGNSPFASALLKHIDTPGVEVMRLFRLVRDEVLRTTRTQEPYYYGTHGAEDQFFVAPKPVEPPKPAPEPPLPGPVDERTMEHTFWQSIQASTDPAEFIAFLEKFPAGTFAALAFERAKTLIDATAGPNVLRRLLGRYPDSKLAPRLRRRLAELQWPQLRKSKDAAALEAFAAEVHDQPEAELARSRAVQLAEAPRPGRRWGMVVAGGLIAMSTVVAGLMWVGIKTPTDDKRLPLKSVALPPSQTTVATPKPTPATQVAPITLKLPCANVEVRVIGTGTRCLDPANPTNREFEDCTTAGAASVCAPRMVVLPKGKYRRGSDTGDADEKPVREVTIDYHLAVGKFEVTFAEWDACAADGGCKHKPETAWGRGRQPVMRVSWNDINSEYLPWLNGKLGLSGAGAYRLLTEAEWEYAVRAGTTTDFSFGPTVTLDQANFNGNFTYAGSVKGVNRQRTIDVGSLNSPNPWGLHDMHGNVWEWVADCYADSYTAAPTDGGKAPEAKDCSRVLRGGGWGDHPQLLRSADRYWSRPGNRYDILGFRLARTLNP